jgi:hypothetical protein
MGSYMRLGLLVGLSVAVVAGVWQLRKTAEAAGYARAIAETQAATDAQAARNAELMRAAELRYHVITPIRTRFITKTVTELRDATQNLAVCPLTPAALGMLRRAADCARSDRPADCGADDAVPRPD